MGERFSGPEWKKDTHGFLVRDAEGRPIRLTLEEQEGQIREQGQDSNGNWYYIRHSEDQYRRRKTVKVRNPKGGFAIINEEDFNPAKHTLWQEEEKK